MMYDNGGHCRHRWERDDANTKQCIRCHKYAPIKEGDFE